jgi:hypothetical protein
MSSRPRPAHGQEGRLTRLVEPRLRRPCAPSTAALDCRAGHALDHRPWRHPDRAGRLARSTCSRAANWRRPRTRGTSSCSRGLARRDARGRRPRGTAGRSRHDQELPRDASSCGRSRRQLGRLRRHGQTSRLEASASARPRRSTRALRRRLGGGRACASSRVLDPPLPGAGQYDVELVLQSGQPLEELLPRRRWPARRRWLAERQVPLRRHRPQDRPPEATRDRRPREGRGPGHGPGGVGRDLGVLLGGGYVNRFNYFDRSYKVIPQIGRRTAPRPARCSTSRSARRQRRAGAGVVVRDASRPQPAPRTLNRFQQRNSGQGLRRRAPGRDQGRGARRCSRRPQGPSRRPTLRDRLRRRVAPDPHEGSSLVPPSASRSC